MAKGCHAFHYAMISSAYAACQMLSSPLLGVLSDRLGRRPILLGGLAATAVVCLGLEWVLCEGVNRCSCSFGWPARSGMHQDSRSFW